MGLITRLLENFGALNLIWEYNEAVNVIADIPINLLENILHELEELKARKIINDYEKISS